MPLPNIGQLPPNEEIFNDENDIFNENADVQPNGENANNNHPIDDAREPNENEHEQEIIDPSGIASGIENLIVDGLPTDDGSNEIDPLLIKDEFVVLNDGKDDEETDSDGAEVFAEEVGDMIIYYEGSSSFKPMKLGIEMKKNDPLSGNLSFDIDVSIVLNFIIIIIFDFIKICNLIKLKQDKKTRYYFVDGGKLQIKNENVQKLIESNKTTNIALFDKHFIRLLMAIFIGLKNLGEGVIHGGVLELIKRMQTN